MKFINLTQNTVYLEDIDRDIPFTNNQPQEIDINDVKKSIGFRRMIQLGQFKIVNPGNSIFERQLLRLQEISMNTKNKPEQPNIKFAERGTDIEVKIKGHFYDAGGYAKVNRNLALGLRKQGVNHEGRFRKNIKYKSRQSKFFRRIYRRFSL